MSNAQIENMKDFIIEEAHEKAEEIKQRAKAESEAAFQELQRKVDKKLDDEFKEKREKFRINKLIEASKKKQSALYSVMELRNNLINQVKKAVVEKMANIEKMSNYDQFLVNLIVQGLIRIQEEKIVIRCRKIDEPIVQNILKTAEEKFKKVVADSTGYTPILAPLTIDTKNYLPGPYVSGSEEEYCSGGIVLSARNGRIICKNTIDARLDVAFYQLTPTIRAQLFGERPKPGQ